MRTLLLILGAALVASTARADEPQINYTAYANCDAATKALVQKVLAGFGGESTLRTLKSVRKVAKIEEKTPRGELKTEFEGIAVFPKSLYARLQLPEAEIRAVSTPKSAFVYRSNAAVKGAAMRLNDSEKTTLGRYFYEEPFLVVRNRVDPAQLLARGAKSKVNGRDVEALYVHLEGLDIEWLVDSETGRVVRTKSGPKVTDYSDFKDVGGGIILPHVLTTSINGKSSSTTRYTRYELNPRVDTNALFTTPTLWATRNAVPDLGRAYDGWWNSGRSFGSYDYQYGNEYGHGSYYDAYSNGYGSASSYVYVLFVDYY